MNNTQRIRRRQSGMTMVEVVTSAVIGTMVLGAALTIFIAGAGMWVRGGEMMETEVQSRQAVRVIANALREAMVVTVDADGQGVTYRLPTRLPDGTFQAPAVWDGVSRRIFHSSGNIRLTDGVGTRTITRNVILTDPDNANAAYQLFVPGAGTVVRQVTIKIVCRRTLPNSVVYLGRKRETIFLRNIPQVTQ